MVRFAGCLVAMAVVALAGVDAQSYYQYENALDDQYDNLLVQDLYKKLAEMESAYEAGEADQPISNDVIETNEPRDQELTQHSAPVINGNLKVSGGTGQGTLKQDGSKVKAGIKTDADLPFYCHPPNPCPKGFTAKDGCMEDVKDDVETQRMWIESMQMKGLCKCDQEHMFHCPRGQAMDADKDEKLNDLFENIIDGADSKENPFVKGDKIVSLVAKKSPRVAKRGGNPFLEGEHLKTMAKKGHPSPMK